LDSIAFTIPLSTMKIAGGPLALNDLFAGRLTSFFRTEGFDCEVGFSARGIRVTDPFGAAMTLDVAEPTDAVETAIYVLSAQPWHACFQGEPKSPFERLADLIADWPEIVGRRRIASRRHPELEVLLQRAVEAVRAHQRASVSFLQRKLQVSYKTASFIMDQLERADIVTAPDASGRREVLIS
jgi:DNA segregation ATPase FtsK/SpoIIIE-like protein